MKAHKKEFMIEKPLRSGFTTGTCAAAAAKAAAVMLFTGKNQYKVELMTPKGIPACLAVETVLAKEGMVCCRVKKDAGDDPDITDGVWVYASVYVQASLDSLSEKARGYYFPGSSNSEAGIYITGGEGVGYVTRPGLSCPIGSYAINPVPRRMVRDAVRNVIRQYAWPCDGQKMVVVQISIPQGTGLSLKTFNPKLGIREGISILGSSGIVEPMSEQALMDTISLEIHMKAVEGTKLLVLTPGNYGEAFLQEQLKLSLDDGVKCSNFIGDAITCTAKEGIPRVLLVGHVGKLVKVAGGVYNTHSRYGDRRMEILADCTKTVMPDEEMPIQSILKANTTEEAFEILKQAGCAGLVADEVISRMLLALSQWSRGQVSVDIVLFSTTHGILGMSKGATEAIRMIKEKGGIV